MDAGRLRRQRQSQFASFAQQSRNAKAAPPKDPLTGLGQQTSVLLQVKEAYGAIQAFLRRMEAQQLLVQPSDRALKAVELKAGAGIQEEGASAHAVEVALDLLRQNPNTF